MPGFSLPAAFLLGVFFDLVLFGAYTIIFGATLWVTNGKHSWLRPTMLAIFMMYILNLGRTAAAIVMGWDAFIGSPDEVMGYFITLSSNRITTFENVTSLVISHIAYATLCWRLYIIWSKDFRVVILPVILLITGTIGGAIATTQGYPQNHSGKGLPKLINSVFAVELTLNWLVTGLIAGRLWSTRKTLSPDGKQRDPYWLVILGVLESGLLISATSVVLLVLYVLGSNGLITFWYAAPKIIGMTLTTTVLLLNLDRRNSPATGMSASGAGTAIVFSTQPLGTSSTMSILDDPEKQKYRTVEVGRHD